MSEESYSAELREISSKWTHASEMRICAVCLCETPRETYADHMRGHGYTTVILVEQVEATK